MAVGVVHGLGAAPPAELAADVRQVELDRRLGEPELLRDLLVRTAGAERRQDPELARGEAAVLRAGCGVGLADAREDRSRVRLADRGREVARQDLLGDERAGAGLQRSPDER